MLFFILTEHGVGPFFSRIHRRFVTDGSQVLEMGVLTTHTPKDLALNLLGMAAAKAILSLVSKMFSVRARAVSLVFLGVMLGLVLITLRWPRFVHPQANVAIFAFQICLVFTYLCGALVAFLDDDPAVAEPPYNQETLPVWYAFLSVNPVLFLLGLKLGKVLFPDAEQAYRDTYAPTSAAAPEPSCAKGHPYALGANAGLPKYAGGAHCDDCGTAVQVRGQPQSLAFGVRTVPVALGNPAACSHSDINP